MPYPMFDRSRLQLKPLSERVHDMQLDEVLPLERAGEPFRRPGAAGDRRADDAGAGAGRAR